MAWGFMKSGCFFVALLLEEATAKEGITDLNGMVMATDATT